GVRIDEILDRAIDRPGILIHDGGNPLVHLVSGHVGTGTGSEHKNLQIRPNGHSAAGHAEDSVARFCRCYKVVSDNGRFRALAANGLRAAPDACRPKGSRPPAPAAAPPAPPRACRRPPRRSPRTLAAGSRNPTSAGPRP